MVRTLIIVFIALLAAGCAGKARPEEIDVAAGEFFERLREANYDKIYDTSAEAFKEQNARATVFDNLQQITAFGRIQDWQRLSMTFGNEGEHRVVLPVYTVRFEQIRCEVTFKFTDDGGTWKLLGFAVRPLGTLQ